MGTSIIGRDEDLDAVADALRHARMVTIVGPGGAGKTTLARSLADRFGVAPHWVELAAVEPDADARTVALRMLGAPDVDTFVAGLGGPAWVVIDNCEPHLEVAAELATELLDAAEELRVVATSRVDLGIDHEIRYPVGPLSVSARSDQPSEAVRLFLTRSEELGAAWPQNEANLAAVDEVVTLLDGIPLAIELAAAQAAALGPAPLVPLLADRPLDVLVDDRGQHRSVRAAVATSLDRLDAGHLSAFLALSVIGFPFDLELAAIVADRSPTDALSTCNTLVRESLLSVAHGDDGTSRFRILEPIRALARERIGDAERTAAEGRYVDAVARFADEAVARAIETYDVATLTDVGRRYDHIVRAIELAMVLDENPDRVFRIILALLAPSCGPRAEIVAIGLRVLDRWPAMLDPEHAAPPLRAEALAVLAHTAALAAREQHALRFARSSLADPSATSIGRVLARRAEAMTLSFTDDDGAARALDEAIAEAAELGGSLERELRTTRLSMEPYDDDVHAELMRLADDAAAGNDIVGLTWVLVGIMNGLVLAGRPEEARAYLARAVERAQTATDRWTGSVLARIQGIVESASGDWEAAARAWRHCLDRHLAHGDIEGVGVGLRLAAGGAECCGRSDVADRLWALQPPGRANTAMPMPFRSEEARLIERHGAPVRMPLSSVVPLVRELFDEAGSEHASPGPEADDAVIRFGEGYELDTARRELRQDGHVIHVEPQVFDVLVHLASNPGRVVTRNELLDAVWDTRFVTAAAVSSRIRSARVATGDDGRRQQVIRTVHGHGFEFVAQVHDRGSRPR